MKKRCVIIGAGPIGCYAAAILSERGYDVEIYEEHKKIGEPLQCTGILTGSYKDIIDIPQEIIMNRVKRVNVFSPHKNKVTINLKREDVVLDRAMFDRYMADIAKEKGAKIFTSHRFVGVYDKGVKVIDIKNLNAKRIEADYIIGADGPNSILRKILNPNKKIEHYIGIQAHVKSKRKRDSYDTFFGKVFPEFFGWIVPDGKNIRIGTASKKNPREVFERFAKEMKIDIKKVKIQGGLIPVYESSLIVKKGNIMIIGDAGTHVKATTGGGIIPGMKGAKEIVDMIDKKGNKRNKDLLLHKELSKHKLARKILNTFSDRDYERLIMVCNGKKIKRILENESRDNMKRFMFKMIVKEPRLLIYAKNIPKLMDFYKNG